ncbi:EpsG family protein [Salipaludibacillus sp. CUR1]|uniref:EpsG family protein n=1 Tax=Salipaludibacillus sp. CUR1 TaxID=2820003 RepID=UPI001E554DF3|nr:EpsG family protein [Salipaludibacillus sp. CUR1]MCE7792512.1 EpsG family protein [Salipaludibacillus sp. CUR1]
MTILYMNLALVFSFSLGARHLRDSALSVTSEAPYMKPGYFFMFVSLASLVVVSGMRNNIGDTYVYRNIFESNEFTWEYVQSQKDMGFGVLQMILKMFTDNAQVLIFTAALITNVLIVLVLYKYTKLFELSLFVFIASGMYLVSMNGIRQYLAAAIIFASTKFILEGSFVKYALVVLLASTFHQSALVLLPIYFIVRREAWTKTTFLILFSAILIVLGYNQFSELLFSTLGEDGYGGYSDFDEGGANIIRVAVGSAPLILAFLGRDKFRELFPKCDYIVNLALLGVIFMIVATQNWLFARLSIYFDLYNLILISWVVHLFAVKDRKLIYYAIVVCYFFFFIYEYVITLNIEYRSDFLEFLDPDKGPLFLQS